MMGKALTVACVGVGYWGKNLVRVFGGLPDVQLKTVCDSNPDAREGIREQYPDVQVEAQYEQVLKDDEIEAVVLAVPAIHHYKAALAAGKHVYVEKPMTLDVAEAQRSLERKGAP